MTRYWLPVAILAALILATLAWLNYLDWNLND